MDFAPSKIGSYWVNEYGDENAQIDVVAVDKQNKRLFIGECKYHKNPVDADVYFDLKRKVEQSKEMAKNFSGYKTIYGVFSKSGFKDRLLDLNQNNPDLILINEDRIV